MMKVKLLAAAVFLGGATLASGCVTETKEGVPQIATGLDVSQPKTHREQDLREKTEKDPKDPQAWFEYGSYWEECLEYATAAQCYERGNELLDQTRWTGGNYLLGKVYFRMQDFEKSMRHLEAVIALESPDPKVSCLNQNFREAHYLRGAIYYLHSRWKDARRDFIRFVELGGEEIRVDEYLEKIDHETG